MIIRPVRFHAFGLLSGVLCLVAVVMQTRADDDSDAVRLRNANRAALRGDLGALRAIIAQDPSVITGPGSDATLLPLHFASIGDRPEVITFLLEHGADVNAAASGGKTPLALAAASCSVEAARVLLKAGADPMPRVFERSEGGVTYYPTPLEFAASRGDPVLVQMLLEKRAPVEYGEGVHRRSALWWACHGPRCPTRYQEPEFAANGKVIKILVQHGADLNFRDNYRRTPLLVAAARGASETVEFLLDTYPGVDRTAVDGEKNTALHLAAGARHEVLGRMPYGASPVETVSALLKRGFDRHARNRTGQTALDVARALDDRAIIKVLEEQPAEEPPR